MTIDLIQGSDEWLAARCGKVTASRMADLLAKTKTGYGASRANYMAELIAERLTGQPAERFTSPAMQWGTANEGDARSAYEFHADCDVAEVGFVPHPGILMAGASPDGLVADDGLVEIKAPLTSTHIETLLTGVIQSKYIKQMMWQMACTDRLWCDFVSYDCRMPDELRLFVKRVPRDDALIEEMEREVRSFLIELDGKIGQLSALAPKGFRHAA